MQAARPPTAASCPPQREGQGAAWRPGSTLQVGAVGEVTGFYPTL